MEDRDFILIDRSFFSSIAMFRALNIDFPTQVISFLRQPDFAFWVRTKEQDRKTRLLKRGMTKEDYSSFEEKLIQKADEAYIQLGLQEIWNHSVKASVSQIVQIVS